MEAENNRSRAVIVGAGPVGSVLAMLLAARGLEVTIYESRSDPRVTFTSGGRSINITIAERGWQALREAGIEAAVRDISIPLMGRSIHQLDGSVEFQPYNRRGDAIYSVARTDLSLLLVELAAATPGVSIRFDHRCVGIDRHHRALRLVNENGMSERRSGVDFDVAFGADGAYSTLRQSLLESESFEMSLRFSQIMYRELRVEPSDDGSWPLPEDRLHLWPRGDGMVVGFPNLDHSHTLSVFLPASGPVSFDSLSTRRAAEAFFRESCPDLLTVAPSLTKDFFRKPPSLLSSSTCAPWILDNWLGLVGDAAHTLLPFLGQGMNAGFEDCTVLADLVGAHGTDWASVLAEYESARRDNSDAVVTLAEEHYLELADSAQSPGFTRRKALEQRIHELDPDHFVPVYDMVAFTSAPYASILERKGVQDRILDHVMDGLAAGQPIDGPAVERLVRSAMDTFDLPPLPSPAAEVGSSAARRPGSGSDASRVPARSMSVSDIRITEPAEGMTRLTACITSSSWPEPREVWFEVPTEVADPAVLTSADPWLAALLLPAMRQHEELRIDAPLSSELLDAMPQLQGIYSTWLPSTVPVDVSTSGVASHGASGDAVGLFFSCGIDSWYSLLKSEDHRRIGRRAEITHLITVAGVDIDVDERKAHILEALAGNTRRIAAEFGLSAISLSTNIRQLYTSVGLSWHWGQAGALGAIALLLQSRFRRIAVAAGPTNANVAMFSEMEAGGCHPLLMPLFSTRLCDLGIDGGEASRLQKVERVAQSSLALETLRICWASHERGYNCGRCAKCVRTSLELQVVGALERCPTLPHPIDPMAIDSMRILFPHEILILEERRDRLADLGADPVLLAALDRSIERSKVEEAGRERALDVLKRTIGPNEAFVIMDEEELRFDLARTHADVRPFTERGGVFNGLPSDDEHAIAELARARAAGASKFVVWSADFWAFEHYRAFALHLEHSFPTIAETLDVRVYDLADHGTG